MNKQELIEFEEEIEELFLQGNIKAPIHLSRGNEDDLIKIFENISPRDWVFSTHRSHYHALLKGIGRDWLRDEILAGRSMHINSSVHRFFSSSIVGGCLPIALGVAMGIKLRGGREQVWVFVGDMAGETGTFRECTNYQAGWHLPVNFVVEDNGLSVNTPTKEVWGGEWDGWLPRIVKYKYKNEYPHVGVGTIVLF